jgi:hypothetical protein
MIRLGSIAHIHLFIFCGLHYKSARADHAGFAYAYAITDCGIYTQKGISANADMSRYNHMGSDKTVIADNAVMPYVVSAPYYYVIADCDERLNSVVLKDEAVIAYYSIVPIRALGTYIAYQFVTLSLGFCIDRRSDFVYFSISYRDIHFVVFW